MSQKVTHKTYPVCIRVARDVLSKASTRHLIRDQLGWIDSSTQKRDDIRMGQVLPHYSRLVEGVRDL